jgi:hypothetical protein
MAKQQNAVTAGTGVVHVYSTLANSQRFTTYTRSSDPGMLPVIDRDVVIKGGAGIADKHLITRHGVYTAISMADYEAIKDLKHWKDLVERGHIRFERKEYDIDKMVGDMNPRDPGGPITPADYEKAAQDGSEPVPKALEEIGKGGLLR